MVPLESDMFVDGVGSDGEGEEFNSEGCRWEEEEAEEEEKQVVIAKPPPVAAAIPEKVLFFLMSYRSYTHYVWLISA